MHMAYLYALRYSWPLRIKYIDMDLRIRKNSAYSDIIIN